jgi:hypothetical protein
MELNFYFVWYSNKYTPFFGYYKAGYIFQTSVFNFYVVSYFYLDVSSIMFFIQFYLTIFCSKLGQLGNFHLM